MGETAAADDGPDETGSGRDGTARPGTGRWVESSWDLRRGLTVREGLPPDADLDEWLAAMLRE